MLKQYDGIEIKIIYLVDADVITESGDGFTDDPWGDLEY